MNAKLKNTNIENLLFFDIETASKSKVLDVNSDEFGIYQYKFRNRETGDLLPDADVIKHYEKNAALYPPYNQIVCISVGFVKDGTLYYKAITGGQKEIIEEFYTLLNTKNLTPTSYNGNSFDLPTVRMKAYESECDVVLVDKFSDSGQKPWTLSDNLLDIMDLVKGTYYSPLSLAECCFMYGVTTPKDDISGADVSRVFHSEGVDRIAAYCNKDVIALAELFCAVQGKRGVIKNFVDKTGIKAEKTPLMNVIANSQEITKEQEKEIIAKAKALSKEERGHFVTLLSAAVLDNAPKYEKLFDKIAK